LIEPAAFNHGHAYRDRVSPADLAAGSVSGFYASRYGHSSEAVWRQRLAAGEICRNGQQLRADGPLSAGDRLVWHRPPWQEAAVPVLPGPLFDDGDLVVFNKPRGLPVLPAGGFLEHTLLRQIERQVAAGALEGRGGMPRPVHRLGRFTSGLLLCARRAASRAWLSALLRESTALGRSVGAPLCESATTVASSQRHCRKTYRALLQPPVAGSPLLDLAPGASLELATPIARRPHGRIGTVWAAALPAGSPSADPACATGPVLAARSLLTLLEPREHGWLVELAIATGRPHQIRIHVAAAGAPLLGDPLYAAGGVPQDRALPGDGGYLLHAHRLQWPTVDGPLMALEAPLPELLGPSADQPRLKAIRREK
jgi:23S rRNA pseudouridine1911/1915/1917 synthase